MEPKSRLQEPNFTGWERFTSRQRNHRERRVSRWRYQRYWKLKTPGKKFFSTTLYDHFWDVNSDIPHFPKNSLTCGYVVRNSSNTRGLCIVFDNVIQKTFFSKKCKKWGGAKKKRPFFGTKYPCINISWAVIKVCLTTTKSQPGGLLRAYVYVNIEKSKKKIVASQKIF